MAINEPGNAERDKDEEARDRRAANLFLLTAALIVVAAGVWLVDAMLAARKADDCLAAGRRNCIPIEAPVKK